MANKPEQRYELRSNSAEEEETELEVIVRDAQGDQPKKPTQPIDVNFQEMMRIIMEGKDVYKRQHSRNKENNKYVEKKTKKIGKRRPQETERYTGRIRYD